MDSLLDVLFGRLQEFEGCVVPEGLVSRSGNRLRRGNCRTGNSPGCTLMSDSGSHFGSPLNGANGPRFGSHPRCTSTSATAPRRPLCKLSETTHRLTAADAAHEHLVVRPRRQRRRRFALGRVNSKNDMLGFRGVRLRSGCTAEKLQIDRFRMADPGNSNTTGTASAVTYCCADRPFWKRSIWSFSTRLLRNRPVKRCDGRRA